MAWIESHQELGQHPKARKLAQLLGIHRMQAIGHLHALWWWALDYAADGDLSKFDVSDIALGAEWDGDPEVFVRALVDCGPRGSSGFLDETDGVLAIHDWHEHTGMLRAARGKARRANHMRWHVNRGVHVDGCQFCAEDSPTNPRGLPHESSGIPQGLPEDSLGESTQHNTTQQNTDPDPPLLIAVDAPPEDDGFEEFWTQYPRRNGVRAGKAAARKLWRKLSPDDRAAARECLPLYAHVKGAYPEDAERYIRHRRWEGLDIEQPSERYDSVEVFR